MIERKLEDLLRYYDANRRVGHTTLMVEGIGSAGEPFFLLAHEHGYAKRILRDAGKCSLGIPLSWASLGGYRSQGMRVPMAIDNSAMMHILNDCLDLVRRQHEIIDVRVAHKTRELFDDRNSVLVSYNKEMAESAALRRERDALLGESVLGFLKRKVKKWTS